VYSPTVGALGDIDIETCRECGGAVKIIPKALAALAGQALACIEDPVVIKKILTHLDEKAAVTETIRLPECRAPPQPGVFELG
jgi:hypothetical protein